MGKHRDGILRWVAIVMALLAGGVLAGPMDLNGQFDVSPTGAATYTIPIQVPPGTAGIEPKLALIYNSQSGNGLLGVGWNLSGLSLITRCPRTMAQDSVRGGVNYDMNDRYCLDGQRLMAIKGSYGADGTEYRTERESFSRIISYGSAGNGPAWFKVWTKAGQILEYGNTTDSRIEAQGKTTVRVWALNKISDTSGDYLTVTYTDDSANGDYYPSRIDYTGNTNTGLVPNNAVQFVYESRIDVDLRFQNGSAARNTVRPTHIRIIRDGNIVWDYGLAYDNAGQRGRTRLLRILECPTDGTCRPSTAFTYVPTSDGLIFQRVGDVLGWGPGGGFTDANRYPIITGDWNGDGKTDFARVQYGAIAFLLSNGDGTFARSGDVLGWGVGDGFTDGNTYPIITGDWNGDGRTDFARVQYGAITFFLSNGDGTFTRSGDVLGWGPGDGFTDATRYPIFTGDWNGDGRTDFARVQYGAITFFLSNGDGTFTRSGDVLGWGPGNGFTDDNTYPIITGDWNGDGKTDFARVQYGAITFFLSNGDGTFTRSGDVLGWGPGGGFTDGNTYPIITGDWNGDGKTDFARVQYGAITFFLSNGDGTFTRSGDVLGWGPGDGFTDATRYPIFTGDWNGDGKTDFARVQYGAITFFLSNGDGTFTRSGDLLGWGPGDGFADGSTYPIITGDWNGAGKSDFARVQYGSITFFADLSQRQDVISSVNPGLGAVTNIAYTSLSNALAYARGTGALYPVQDIQQPLYVVSQAQSSNGVGGSKTTNYQYGSMKADLSGRGLLGFGWMQATSVDTAVAVKTTYRQDWPYVGLPSQVKKTVSSGGNNGVVSQTSYAYGCLNPQLGSACTMSAGNSYFPYVSQSVESGWDLNGTAMPSVTTTNQFDVYGNATQVSVTSSDGSSKTTTNTYTNDTTNWYLGRLLRSQVQSVAP